MYYQMMAILGIETRPVNQVKSTANDVTSCESWPVGLASARTAETVPIIAVIAVGMFVPAWQPIHVHALCAKTDAHVAVAAFRNYLHLEVVDAAGGGYGVGGSDRGCVFVCLAVALVLHAQVVEGQANVVELVLAGPTTG